MSLLPKLGSFLPKVSSVIGGIPHTWVIYGAVVGLAFTVGLATGNSWATKHALEIQSEANKDWRERVMRDHAARIADANRRISEAMAQARVADDVAIETVRVTDTAARDAHEAALTQLANERELANATCNAQTVTFSPTARRLLDAGAGAIAEQPGRNDPAGPAPSGTVGTVPAAAPLTCEELYEGYANLGRHDVEVMGRLKALQERIRARQ